LRASDRPAGAAFSFGVAVGNDECAAERAPVATKY
jgi:hypothetical protein